LLRPVSYGVGHSAAETSLWAHAFGGSSLAWSRWSTGTKSAHGAGGASMLDASRAKVYVVDGGTQFNASHLNLVTRAWVNDATLPATLPDSNADSIWGAFHDAADIGVYCTRNAAQSVVRLYWFPGSSLGQARNAVTWTNGSGLPGGYAGQLLYVPDLQKLIWYSQRADIRDKYYEITVPLNAANPWTWEEKTITGAGRPGALADGVSDWVYRRLGYSPRLKSLIYVTGLPQDRFSFGGAVLCIRVA